MLRFYFEVTDLRFKKKMFVTHKPSPCLTHSPPSIGLVLCVCVSHPTGVGLRLRAQLLPPVTGCVLRAAAAQEEPLCRDGPECRQAQLLHALLLCTFCLLD